MPDFRRDATNPLATLGPGCTFCLPSGLAFPIAGPTPLWRTVFCWIALLPLLRALLANDKTGNPLTLRQGAWLGYACGFLWYLGNCYWIYQTMYLYGGLAKPIAAGILVLFCLYLGLYHALFGTSLSLVTDASAGRLPSYSSLRLGRGGTGARPHHRPSVGYSRRRAGRQPSVDSPRTYHRSLRTLLHHCRGQRTLARPHSASGAPLHRPVLTAVGVAIIVVYIVGMRLIANPNASPTTATATLVQENIEVGAANSGPQPTTQFLESFSYLSRYPSQRFLLGIPELPGTPSVYLIRQQAAGTEASEHPPTPADLIVWPEAPSGFFTTDPDFRRRMNDLAASSQALLIIGNIGIDPNPNPTRERPYFRYDSAAIFTPDGGYQTRYDKIHLVPWGEYIPFKQFFFFASKLTAGAGDIDRGSIRTVFPFRGHTYGTFVCYESIFGDEVRQFVKNGAEVLVNISDDGWYGDTSAGWQHLNMVRMRAIENHRWILRSTNTGVTAAINPYGRVTAAAPRHQRPASAFTSATNTT